MDSMVVTYSKPGAISLWGVDMNRSGKPAILFSTDPINLITRHHTDLGNLRLTKSVGTFQSGVCCSVVLLELPLRVIGYISQLLHVESVGDLNLFPRPRFVSVTFLTITHLPHLQPKYWCPRPGSARVECRARIGFL